MKKSGICLFIIVLLAVSCAKSRFATTTRHEHDGKVTYANHYSNERRKLVRQKPVRPAAPARDATAKTTANPVDNPDAINRMNLIASTDKNYLDLSHVEKLVSHYAARLYPEFYHEKKLAQPGHPRDPSAKGLESVTSKKLTRHDGTAVTKGDSIKQNAAGTGKAGQPKTEKLGLAGFILSFFGIVPLFGIPFALLGIIFGAISLKKIKRNPEKYKGKGLATASIVIGSIMLLINIIILVTSISAANDPPSPNLNSSSTSCRF